jgi:predicted amidohydrolase YtcJ
LVGICLFVLGACAQPVDLVARCDALASEHFPGVDINAATAVTDREDLPGFCQITGTIEPNIGFEARLPLADWNGKYYQAGCGGYCGMVLPDKPGFSNTINEALKRGYAAITTDGGHQASIGDPSWAEGNPDAVEIYGHRVIPLTHQAGIQLTSAFYGSEPAREYFGGCSNGGRMAAMAAQRYPELFDGILGGAGVLNLSQSGGIYGSWIVQSNTGDDGKRILSKANFADKIPLLEDEVMRQCDAADGAKDGLINAPRQCAVNFDALPDCSAAGNAQCFTAEEKDVLRAWYQGPRNSAGEQLQPGMPPGGERFIDVWFLDPEDGVAVGNQLGGGFAKYLGFEGGTPDDYTALDFDFDNDPQRLTRNAKALDALDPDIRGFRDAGGKYLMWHGWGDSLVLPDQSKDYYESVAAEMGGYDEIESFYRLFLIPGMGHCWEIPARTPDRFDPITILDQWVETGTAPDVLRATPVEPGSTAISELVVHPHLSPTPAADVVFIGDNIITMDEATAGATGVAVRDDRIIAVGDRDAALALAGEATRIVRLGDRALLPGFIDAHGHLTFVARTLEFENLSSPPVGTVNSIDDIVNLLKVRLAEDPPAPGEWLIGFGYDESLLAEQRHPTRDDLDRVSTEVPIALVHVSVHLAAANSAALNAANLSAKSENPPGGVIRRRPGSDEPNGVLEETAAHALVMPRIFAVDDDKLVRQTRRAINQYLSYGITTIQDGAATPSDVGVLTSAAESEPFVADVAAYVAADRLSPDELEAFSAAPDYENGFRIAGAKLFLDGSVQGKTAWLSKPYKEGLPDSPADYRGYSRIEPAEYSRLASALLANRVPILVHANGDAAIDAMLDGIEKAEPGLDHRSVIIHAQLMRQDQIERAATLGAVPSFFSAHPYFWGDWHRQILGEPRAENISPVRWAVDANLNWTIHNDAPIVPPDIMRLIAITVNRGTRSGYVLGEHQQASVLEALHAVTLGAAWQYREEDRKGSITAGKQADLVILAKDPRTAEAGELADIAIIETFTRGNSVYTQLDSGQQ